MALKEYKPGTAFTGVVGRTFDVSSPAWPEPLRAKQGAPNVLFIVQDDTGFGQMGCYGSPISTPNIDAARQERSAVQQHAHHRAVFAHALVHPDRPQSPLERDVVHHRGINWLSRWERQHPVRERHALGDAAPARLQHLCARQVAPDSGRPDLGGRSYDRWPLGRGFERYYGFLGGDTHQYYPELVYDNHGVEQEKIPRRRLPPD